MTCVHLQELFDLCREHDLKLGGSDLIRVVCRQCGQQEVCPSTLVAPPGEATPGSVAPPQPTATPAKAAS
jgi:hypothetical protein